MRGVRIGQRNGLPLVREEDSLFTKERLSAYVCSVRGRPTVRRLWATCSIVSCAARARGRGPQARRTTQRSPPVRPPPLLPERPRAAAVPCSSPRGPRGGAHASG